MSSMPQGLSKEQNSKQQSSHSLLNQNQHSTYASNSAIQNSPSPIHSHNTNPSSQANPSLAVLLQLFDKIRTLCKQCKLSDIPPKLTPSDLSHLLPSFPSSSPQPTPIHSYFASLDTLRCRIYSFFQQQQQYHKLQQILQKNQTEIRQHIAGRQNNNLNCMLRI